MSKLEYTCEMFRIRFYERTRFRGYRGKRRGKVARVEAHMDRQRLRHMVLDIADLVLEAKQARGAA